VQDAVITPPSKNEYDVDAYERHLRNTDGARNNAALALFFFVAAQNLNAFSCARV